MSFQDRCLRRKSEPDRLLLVKRDGPQSVNRYTRSLMASKGINGAFIILSTTAESDGHSAHSGLDLQPKDARQLRDWLTDFIERTDV